MSEYNKTHFFNVEVAKKTDERTAIIFQNLAMWIEKNKSNDKHFYDGYYWTYNSVTAFAEMFPYLSKDKIRRVLNNLEENGYILTGNYNKVKFDKTTWYAITEKGWALYKPDEDLQGSDFDVANLPNELAHTPISSGKNAKPIPYRNHIETAYRNNNTIVKKGDSAKPKPKKDTYGEFGNVKLTQEEYDKLIEKLGVDETCKFIERVSTYVEQKGKYYNSHYATILAWKRKDEEKNPSKPKEEGFEYSEITRI